MSVVEVLISVAIVALLIALLAPSLGSLRRAGHDAKTLAALRDHARIFHMYTTDYADQWPRFADPEHLNVVRSHATGVAVAIQYFNQKSDWPVALTDSYYDGRLSPELFHSPSAGPLIFSSPVTTYSTYVYACAFVGRPEFWQPETRVVPPSQLRSTGASDVTWPTSKSLLVSAYPWFEDRRLVLATCVDGHGRAVVPGAFERGYPEGLEQFELLGGDNGDDPPMLHTAGGVRGRDFKPGG